MVKVSMLMLLWQIIQIKHYEKFVFLVSKKTLWSKKQRNLWSSSIKK
jgi:hypothetical protein